MRHRLAARVMLSLAILAGFGRSVSADQWSVTAFTGNASTAATDLEVTAPGTSIRMARVPIDDQSSKSPIYYGGRITRHLPKTPWLAVEVEFVHFKAITSPESIVPMRGRFDGQRLDERRPLGTVLPRFELSHGLNLLMGNAAVRIPLIKSPGLGQSGLLAVTLRAGAGPTIPHVEATYLGSAVDEYRLAHPCFQGAIALEVGLSQRLRVVSEGKWTTTRQHLSLGEGTLEGAFSTWHVIGGLGWQFAPSRQQGKP